jgi:hypothetical protein
MTSREVVCEMLARQGVTEPDRKQLRTMLGDVHGSLEKHNGKSVTRGEGMPARWAIAS